MSHSYSNISYALSNQYFMTFKHETTHICPFLLSFEIKFGLQYNSQLGRRAAIMRKTVTSNIMFTFGIQCAAHQDLPVRQDLYLSTCM